MARFFSRNRSILKYLATLNKEKSFTERLTASNEVVQREEDNEEKKRDLGLFTKEEDIKIEDSATVTTLLSNVAASGITSKDAIVNLPSSGLTAGDASIVFIDSNTAKYYISNGEGWYNATFANVDPQWDSAPNSSYTLDSTNPLTIEPIAIDSGGKIFSYTATLNSDANQFLTVTKDSADGRIFTLVGDSEGGVPSSSNSGVVTFKASDGIGLVIQNSTINLSYGASDITGITLLLVGGGGGGGGSPHGGGGGSGGGLLVQNATLSGDTTTNITVGDGGTGYTGRISSPWPSAGTNKGTNGGNTTAFGYTAIGGGAGGGYSGGNLSDTPGQDGGSGGGGTDESAAGSATQTSPSGTTGYGNDGGTSTSNTYSKGGGGMGAAGGAQSQGGAGYDFSAIFGTNVGVSGVFGGGGGGSVYNGLSTTSYRAGGSGGGGDGGQNNSAPYAPTNGTANTGGGGGGAERVSPGKGGDGGSGVVLVKVLTSNTGNITTTGSPTSHTFGSYTIYEFTQDGSITNGTV